MAFHNQVFPLDLAALKASPNWPTNIIKLGGGSEQRVGLQADSLRQYDATTAISSITVFNQVVQHFNARRGPLFSFPLRDKTLFKVTLHPFATGGGIGSTNQLIVNEGDASNAYNREIYLPESGTVQIRANGNLKTESTDYTLNYSGANGGLVTWLTSVSGQSLTWTGNFYVPVRFEVDSLADVELIAMTSATGGKTRGPSAPMIEVYYPGEYL